MKLNTVAFTAAVFMISLLQVVIVQIRANEAMPLGGGGVKSIYQHNYGFSQVEEEGEGEGELLYSHQKEEEEEKEEEEKEEKEEKEKAELIVIKEEVLRGIENGFPVVALESTVISHGMPYPQNLATGLEIEHIIRSKGAIPATIAILNGRIHVGLTEDELRELALAGHNAIKTSRRDVAYVVSTNKIGATTVSATSLIAAKVGIKVFVTGGIGGVHRQGETTMDVSADLKELGRTPIAVVCAGTKSILDIGRTLEYLETEGVAVIGYNTDEFPAFFTPRSGFPVSARLNTSEQCAKLIDANDKLKLRSGIVIAVPINSEDAGDFISLEHATQQALKDADDLHITGKEVTPFLLQRIKEITGGASLKANIELIKNNAHVGASIAVSLSQLHESQGGFSRATDKPSVVVIGGVVVDLISQAHKTLISGTSNPGKITQRYGGVARNVAEMLARLGATPLLISAVGQDSQAETLRVYCNELGILTQALLVSSKYSTAVYNAILDVTGEMEVAIADMDVFKELTPPFVKSYTNYVNSAPIVYIDANIPEETIETIVNFVGCDTKVWFEPTSVPKSKKVAKRSILEKISFISPNRYEIAAIAKELDPSVDETQLDLQTCKSYIHLLLATGVENVILKVGADGVIVGSKNKISEDATQVENMFIKHYKPFQPNQILSVTGAGDSLAGAIIFSLLQHKTLDESITFGLIGAKMSLESDYSISPLINKDLWRKFHNLHK